MSLARTQLIKFLEQDGHLEIATAVSKWESDQLTVEQKEVLLRYQSRVKSDLEPKGHLIENSLVHVSTSGWGNESESTTPGMWQI